MTDIQNLTLRSSIFLGGATATGKSVLALGLAEALGGEIVSVDSMQVYRGLDIGTAKPSQKDQQRVPHHLLDIATLEENFDAARFVTHARESAQAILGRGKVPIFCGGTGLYFKAYLYGLGASPAPDPAIREAVEKTPLEALLAELQVADPEGYERMDKHNPRRVRRAIEVLRQTGQPFSRQKAIWPGKPDAEPGEGVFFPGVHREPADLQERIHQRVERMFKEGLVDETRRALGNGLAGNRTAMQAIGYRQVVDYLEGRITLAETIDMVKIRTRQFAKRQMTWFKHQLPVHWLLVEKTARWDTLVEGLVEQYQQKVRP